MQFDLLSPELEALGRQVVDVAYTVHKELGPGLLESVYQKCFCWELEQRKIPYLHEATLPIQYKHLDIDGGLRIDIMVADQVVVELKSVDELQPISMAQMITYLKLSRRPLGYLINFNTPLIRDGIKRVVLTNHPPRPGTPRE